MALVTLQQCQQNIWDDLDDPNGQYWQASSLTRWINDACSDVAKRAECLQETDQIPTVAAVKTQVMATTNSIIRVHRAEWTPDNVQIYPLEIRNINEMDSIWGIYQNIQNAWPSWIVFWQEPPVLLAQYYPVPGGNGFLNIWYYRNAIPVANPTDLLDLPDGWEPCARFYAEYMALRRAGDPRWSELRDLYEENLLALKTATRTYTDAAGQISPQTYGGAFYGTDLWG